MALTFYDGLAAYWIAESWIKFLKPTDNLISDGNVEFLPHAGVYFVRSTSMAVDEYGGSGSFLGTFFVLESRWQTYCRVD